MILKLLEALFDNVAGPINAQSDKRIPDDARAVVDMVKLGTGVH